ncbi:adenylosuccinate lyase [Endomicrobiia bacterium]|uniref:Adenylosuccinate lyase n=1 Tax=Endomicrobium trichonymphae TaxID=1408204 RepID=B1GYX6_ENDTX|nr:adenylosuccinate lyase [Candidatus Endomicrobium trichonymphae]BAG14219.1 adenylosuccinate lyase [Candidatus Endomicrobium trichonymphae]BAV59276.1 adenylosuccinate lyase [Candidatus Endomicrobium trichonymphae]GHT15107.1 adenylosuccinate lyase [Endomicrobiia bacterium]GMO51424.1 MAG: adenylosuccinate lyase [Candidatus Endomicrobium trichonymphae]
MIRRYTKPEMAAIWSDENRFKKMLDVEIFAAEAMSELGTVPEKAVEIIKKKAKINVERINEIELTVKHDVISFLTAVVETTGPDGRFLHLGMTSSDVLDTATGAQLKQASRLLIGETKKLTVIISDLAKKYKMTPIMGRTHGVHAEPMTFGLKAASWYCEVMRSLDRLNFALETVSYGKISGAVGTMAHLDPKVEEYVCKKMGLKPETVSTQIIPRDRYSIYFSTLAHLGSALERIATEIRHLQKTEVVEAEEPFTKGQKGSSAMPHKRNPIISENICGLARLLRGYAATAMENIALWHERDISHSSTERIMFPDASIISHYMLIRMQTLLSGLNVYPENMQINMDKTKDVIFSGTLLLSLVDKGMSREDAYAVVQAAAFDARDNKISLEEAYLKSWDIKKYLSAEEIKRDCDVKSQFKNIDYIFKRTFNE